MKKILTVMLLMLLTASLCACSREEGPPVVIYALESSENTPEQISETDCFYNVGAFFREGGFLRYEAGETMTGVDVSAWQGDIDWQLAARSGVEFAMIRAGYRGYTDGELFEDSYFKKNVEGALNAGLQVGVYFFSQAVTGAEAIEEANFVIDLIGDYDITLPVAFDWEHYHGEADGRANDLETQALCDNAVLFCSLIEKAGFEPMIYFNIELAHNRYDLDSIDDYDFWYAEYADAPHFQRECRLWQYTSTGAVNGIEGAVDLNLWFVPNQSEE